MPEALVEPAPEHPAARLAVVIPLPPPPGPRAAELEARRRHPSARRS